MKFFNKEAENLCNKLIDNANALIFYLDNFGLITMCNKKSENLTGLARKDILGKNWLDVLYGSSSAGIKKQMFKSVMDDSVTYRRNNNFEGLFCDSAGKEKFISWNITPIASEGGFDGTLLIGNDFTQLKAKEASHKKIDDTLRDIFASIKEYALFVTNLQGKIIYYGMGSGVMFGWLKKEIIFKDASVLYSNEGKNSLSFIIKQVNISGQHEAELDLVKKDGSSFPVTLTVTRLLDADAKLKGYIFIAKDITERKKLEYQLLQAEKLVAIGQLAAGMAHEINNPIFVISGRAEMLLDDVDLSKKTRNDIEIINAQADRIRKLVDSLLKFSRHNPRQLQEANINDMIEGVLPLITYHKLPSHDVEIIKDFAPDLRPVKADLNQLQEVFLNLFINAFQAMPKGGKLTIVTKNIGDRFAQIQVIDTGVGIEEKNLKNIFMPFFSTKKEGTGLGLPICYNIVKDYGGDMFVDTQINKGATFTVRLPFA
ncbi:MAG: PAS domain S-box protein [Candidatus Omnitrophica bacterium]|nr:PAS domain S-box protein [Candidatus Omnitrophota bacterium]